MSNFFKQRREALELTEQVALGFLDRVAAFDRHDFFQGKIDEMKLGVSGLLEAAMNVDYEFHDVRGIDGSRQEHNRLLENGVRERFELNLFKHRPQVHLRFLKKASPLIGVEVRFLRRADSPSSYEPSIELKAPGSTICFWHYRPKHFSTRHKRIGNKYRTKRNFELAFPFEMPLFNP